MAKRARPRLVLPALLALLLAPALAGCVSEQRLDFACRAREGAPAHPYDAAALVALVTVEDEGAPLASDVREALVAQAARQVLTPGGAPYDAFEGALRPWFPVREGAELQTWVFEANGTWPGGRDTYAQAFLVRDGVVQPPASELVVAPARLRDAATATANASDDAAEALARKPDLVNAAWDPARPSCLVLQYGCWSGDGRTCSAAPAFAQTTPAPPPAAPTPTPGPPTYVWVDMTRARVVAVEETAA